MENQCIVRGISKIQAIIFLKNFDWSDFFLFPLSKWNKKHLLWKKQKKLKEYSLNRYCSKNGKLKAKEYYENNKKRLHERPQKIYRNLSEEKKDKNRICKKLIQKYAQRR